MDFRRQKRKSTLGNRSKDFNNTFNASHNNQGVTSNYDGSFIAPYRLNENKAPRKSMLGTHKAKRESTLPSTSGCLSCCENSLTVNTYSSKPERISMIPYHITDFSNQIIRNEKPVRNEKVTKFNSSLSPLKNLVLDVTLTNSIDKDNRSTTLVRDSMSSLANDSFLSCNNSFNCEETLTKLIEDTDITLNRESILPASNVKPIPPCKNETVQGEKITLEDTISGATDTNDATIKINSFSSPFGSCENVLSDKLETSYSEGHLFSPICSSTNSRKPNVQSSKHTKRSKESLEDVSFINKTDDVSRALKYLDMLIERSANLVGNYEVQIKEAYLKLEDSKKELENLRTVRKFMTKVISVPKCEKENKPPKNTLSDTEGKEEFNSPQYSSKQVIQEMRSTIKFLKTPRMSRAPRQSMLLTPHTMSFCIKSQYEKLLE